MKSGQPSRTAEYMAFFRAWESARPEGKRLFVDNFARHFIRRSLRVAVWFSTMPVLGPLVRWYVDRRLPGARTSAIARTRLIDESVCQALRDGLRQVVVLGAGFDCRAYRLPGINSAAVFEVDSRLQTFPLTEPASPIPGKRPSRAGRLQSRQTAGAFGGCRI